MSKTFIFPKKLILIIIIIIIFIFFFIYINSIKEFYNISNTNLIYSDHNKPTWNSKDINSFYYDLLGFTIKKNPNLVYTNENITGCEYENGIIFKSNRNLKNIKIGLSSNLKNIIFGFNFYKNYFNLIENDEPISINICDYIPSLCNDGTFLQDLDKNESFYGIFCINQIIYYFFQKSSNGKGIIIHKSDIKPQFPLRAVISNTRNSNTFTDIYWLNKLYQGPSITYEVKFDQNEFDQNENDGPGPSPAIDNCSDINTLKKATICIKSVSYNTISSQMIITYKNNFNINKIYGKKVYIKGNININKVNLIIVLNKREIVIPLNNNNFINEEVLNIILDKYKRYLNYNKNFFIKFEVYTDFNKIVSKDKKVDII